jgi:4-amino-4-deoxy-L-arabinose transferase-like glycosyltransferase
VTLAARPAPATPDALPVRSLLVLAAVASVPRLLAAALLRHGVIFSDMLSYHAKALRIARGLPYGVRDRVPLYPRMIAWVYELAGVHASAVYVMQSLLEAAVIVLLASVVSRRFGRKAGLATGIFGALFPSRFFYSGLLLSENLAVILMCCLAAALLFLEERPTPARAFLTGSLSGLAFLARPVLCLTVGGAIVLLCLTPISRRGRLQLGALAVAGFLLAAAPWVWITWVDTDHLLVGDLAAGKSFWIGNNPDATGRFTLPPATAVWGSSDPYLLDARVRREGVVYALSHPGRTILLWLPKTSYWWSPEHRDLMYLYSNSWIPTLPPAAIWFVYLLVGLGFAFLVPFALRGALGAWTPALAGCIVAAVSMWGLSLVSYGDSRFHIPALPFLWLFAGLGLTSRQRLSGRRRAVCAVLTLLFLGNAAYDLVTSASTVRRLAAPDGTTLRYGYEIWR